VVGAADGNLHIPVPSMDRFNLTKPATFSILLCLAFFYGFCFSLFYKSLYYLVAVLNGFKKGSESENNTDVFKLLW
jgi:hypothetical protein